VSTQLLLTNISCHTCIYHHIS